MSLIGLWYYKKCGVKTLMIVAILLSGTMHIEIQGPKSTNQKRLSAYCLAPIGVSLAMKNKVQKNCGYKYKPFFVSHDQIQIIFWPKRAINKDEFCVECF